MERMSADDLPGYPDELVTTGMHIVPFTVSPHYGPDPGAAGANSLVDYFIDNHIPFVALRDGEAVVVDGDSMRVVGDRRLEQGRPTFPSYAGIRSRVSRRASRG